MDSLSLNSYVIGFGAFLIVVLTPYVIFFYSERRNKKEHNEYLKRIRKHKL